jgi:predicted nucleic acid-binding protein
LGIFLLAKQRGLLKEIKPLLDILIADSIRISDALYQKILKKANE